MLLVHMAVTVCSHVVFVFLHEEEELIHNSQLNNATETRPGGALVTRFV